MYKYLFKMQQLTQKILLATRVYLYSADSIPYHILTTP